ncbi:MAG: DUF2785 domain-containing protein [Planctomycetes bacterium]|nr:DUF2785 domain-containing protein [Planctomycetota bacterium]
MRMHMLIGLAASGFAGLAAQTPATSAPTESVAAWSRFTAESAPLPSTAELPALLDRLTALLANPDPALRDDVAYTLLSKWLRAPHLVSDEQCRALVGTWSARLTAGVGERDTDAVCGRSFAALSLALLAARDLDAPFLDRAAFDALLAAALDYFAAERDVRGLDARLGWVHSVAHTADLLTFLARSPQLSVPQQAALLAAISAKLATVEVPLVAGEDERIARAILSVCARDDFARGAFAAWLAALCRERYRGEPLVELARRENRKHVLVSLFALLSLDERTAPSLATARDELRRALGG